MVDVFLDPYRSFMVTTVIWKCLHNSQKACYKGYEEEQLPDKPKALAFQSYTASFSKFTINPNSQPAEQTNEQHAFAGKRKFPQSLSSFKEKGKSIQMCESITSPVLV